MAIGSMASLGIGGSGVLSWETLNQLKDNEVKHQVDPIKKKIETNMEKQKELTTLLTDMSLLKSNFTKLSDFSTFQQRKASVEGIGVKATAGEGLAVQDIKVKVKQLAQNDISEFGKKFASRDEAFSNTNTTIKFHHNGTDYSVDVRAGMSIADVGQAITDATDGKVMGIIMKTSGETPYQLMIQGKDSGKDNRVYFGSTVTSAPMSGGKIEGGKIDLTIGGHKLEVKLDGLQGKESNTSEENSELILNAIKDEIKKQAGNNNTDAKAIQEKIDKGEITIELGKGGKGLFINDSSGGKIDIKATGVKISTLGTAAQETKLGFENAHTKSEPLVKGQAVSKDTIQGKININGQEIDLSGKQGADAVKDAINALTTKTGVTATVENGKLLLSSDKKIDIKPVGDDKKVLESIGLSAGTYTSSSDFVNEVGGIKNIQKAQNAEFSYNGINVERDKNTIDDVVSGLTLELTNVTKENEDVTVRIARDDEGLSDIVDEMVENYNKVYNKIKELVKYDEDTKVSGLFNGNSEMRSITRQLNSIFNSNDVKGRSLVEFGIYLNEDGTLKFEKEKFENSYNKDPENAIDFFRITSTSVNGKESETDGVFMRLKNTMDSLITGEKSTLKSLEASLTHEHDTLAEDQKKTQNRIDTRYDTMAEKWSIYDQMLAKIQNAGNVVMGMINAANN